MNITCAAPFNEGLEGLYRVVDCGLNYVFTQFEATSARLAFPGFDEPAFKVKFGACITAPVEMHTTANTLMVKKDLVADKASYAKATYATKGKGKDFECALAHIQGEFMLLGSGRVAYVMPNPNGAGYYHFMVKSGWEHFYENRDELNAFF